MITAAAQPDRLDTAFGIVVALVLWTVVVILAIRGAS